MTGRLDFGRNFSPCRLQQLIGLATSFAHHAFSLFRCLLASGIISRLHLCINSASFLLVLSRQTLGFFKKSKQEVTEPDLFIFLVPSDFHGYFPGYSNVIAQSRDKLTWAVLKSHTDNYAGTVTLKDTNPLSKPNINFKYYEEGSNPESKDLEAMLDGIEFVRTINSNATNTLDILDLSAGLPEGSSGFQYPNIAETIPGPEFKKRDKLREWVRRNSWGHHACGTCKMGKESDPMAVVNSKFEVIGTKSLRIVDASVFPRIPGYFIASSVYTMSERATDEILQARGRQRRVEV
ncbi:MAG: hypothetical protein EOP09_14260 [Proteobacteria bacterium]|nr:MAG: hypothetical protein EOP09_14260 [Pseudomonadota bacterium]